MATLRLRLERWFSSITESYFLRATVETLGTVPPEILASLKIKRADLDERRPPELVGFCTRIEMENIPHNGGLNTFHLPELDDTDFPLILGNFIEMAAVDVPLPWQELGVSGAQAFSVVAITPLLKTAQVSGTLACGVLPVTFSIPVLPLIGTDGLPTYVRTYYPESDYIRDTEFVAPYDDLAGVVSMVDTLKTGAQDLVDEWNEYESNFDGLDLEIFE
jgi:hypothetical protein